MNFLDRIFAKRLLNNPDFNKIVDNPIYQSFAFGSGWRFQDFNSLDAINKGYAKNADLYSIVKRIAQTAARVPLALYEYNKDGEKELIEDGELYELIESPNRLQTRQEFIEEALTYLLLTGNIYTAIYKALGFGEKVLELNNLPSQRMTIVGGDMSNPIKEYWFQEEYNIKFEADKIIHTRYPNPKGESIVDRMYGLSPLEAGYNALQSSNNVYDAKGNIIKSQGVNGIISSGSERSLTKEQADLMQEAWDKKNSNPKQFGRNLMTSANINYTQLGLSPDKLQLLQSGIFDLRSLCRIYNVDAKLFGDEAASTYNNMLDARKAMYTDAILPNLELFLMKLNQGFIYTWSKAENKEYCLEADTSEIEVLQADQKLEAEKDKIKMEGIKSILEMPITPEAKAMLLEKEYNYTEEEAQLISTANVNRE